MIIEATYLGPFLKVKVPGYEHKLVKRDETVKLRIRDGQPLGGCWKIVKGKTAYEAGLKKAEKEREASKKKRLEAKAKAKAEADKRRDKVIDAAHRKQLDVQAEVERDKATKPDKKG